MHVYFIFPALVGLVFVLFRYSVTRNRGTYKERMEEYIENDRRSNFARKKEIPAELFVTPDISRLPLPSFPPTDSYKLLSAKQARFEKASRLPMIKLEHAISNTDLKMSYGAVNLDLISTYEDNYNKYLRTLVNYAEELIKHELYDDAEAILCEGLEFGSDLTQSYTLLADVYSAQGKKDMLSKLYSSIADDSGVYMENPVLKRKILDYINNKLQ